MGVYLHNLLVWEVQTPAHTVVGQVQVANNIPDMLGPKGMGEESKDQIKVEKKDYSVLDKIDISGCDTLSPEEQAATSTLLLDFIRLFVKDEIDLDQRSIVKHEIKGE